MDDVTFVHKLFLRKKEKFQYTKGVIRCKQLLIRMWHPSRYTLENR